MKRKGEEEEEKTDEPHLDLAAGYAP